jgi:integrase
MKQASKKLTTDKPSPDFPLTPHRGTKRWCKKIRGRLHYFGPLDDPQAALLKWQEQRDDLLAGRLPRPKDEAGLTLEKLINKFLNAKRAAVESGDLSAATWMDYHRSSRIVAKVFSKHRLVLDLRGDDFAKLRAHLAKSLGPVKMASTITEIRVLFNWAFKAELIDRPVSYGMGFARPTKKALREERNKKGERILEPAELRRLIDEAGQPMKAMILLALNCGFGNNDVGLLPLAAIDLDKSWVTFPRPKTAIKRRCPLWPETVSALREWLAVRPAPKDDAHAEFIFVTKYGGIWAKQPTMPKDNKSVAKRTTDNPVAKEMRKLLDKLGLYREGISFYSLRHVFESIGGESRDQPAVDLIMGHAPASNDMAAVYRERISDQRLVDVVNIVRTWLYAGDDADDSKEGAITLRIHAPQGDEVPARKAK